VYLIGLRIAIRALVNKTKNIYSYNSSSFFNSIIDDPYFFSVFQKSLQVVSKDKKCLKAFFGFFEKNENDTKKQKSAEYYFNQANTHYEKQELDQALEDYNQAIQLNPDLAKAYSNRGAVYGKQGKLEKALEDFNQAIQLNPDLAEAYRNRGIIYKKQGNQEKAIQDLEKAASLYQQQGKTRKYQELQQLL